MTLQDYIAFAEDPTNHGKFILKEMEVGVMEQGEDGKETGKKQKIVMRITLEEGGALKYSHFDEENIVKQAEELAAKKGALEKVLAEAKDMEIIKLPVTEDEPVEGEIILE